MKTLIIGLTIFFAVQITGAAQVNACYNYLTFQEFQKFYTPGDTVYLKSLYKAIKYPAISRKKEQEGVVRVQVLNHSKDSIEIILSGSTFQPLLDETLEKVSQVNSEHLINNDAKFITEFYIDYDLEPFNSENNCGANVDECNYVTILAYRVPIISRN